MNLISTYFIAVPFAVFANTNAQDKRAILKRI
jgi:hypothetical protein